MRPSLKPAALALLLGLAACGPKPTASPSTTADVAPKVEPKCPDPSIKDANNPCSPYYYKPVKGSFKGQKSF